MLTESLVWVFVWRDIFPIECYLPCLIQEAATRNLVVIKQQVPEDSKEVSKDNETVSTSRINQSIIIKLSILPQQHSPIVQPIQP